LKIATEGTPMHMNLQRFLFRWLAVPALSVLLLPLSVGSADAQAPGAKEGLLAGCTNSNNCVSSNALDEKAHIAPFKVALPPEQAWTGLQRVIEATPDAKIIQVTPDYLQVEFTTKLLFTDDVEFLLRRGQEEIAVRSASRTGYYDFGANRKRIEALRVQLREKGIIE